MRRILALGSVLAAIACSAASALAAGYATDDDGVLYQVTPDQSLVERIGPVEVKSKRKDGKTVSFQPTLTDLALSDLHGLYGISYTTLYRIDPRRPDRSTRIGDLRANGFGSFNALAFDDKGRLFALESGTLHQVDLKTGRARVLGSLGGNWYSDGDLAWFGGALYATVNGGTSNACHLVRIDMKTWKATDIGAIRRAARLRDEKPPAKGAKGDKARKPKKRSVVVRTFDDVWGLIWDGRDLYGVTPQGELIQIDYRSGRAIVVTRVKATFYGSCAMLRI